MDAATRPSTLANIGEGFRGLLKPRANTEGSATVTMDRHHPVTTEPKGKLCP